ncbi:uncharacterized protein LOC132042829 [Lycium ferocissimum]|uniref:uncharacterized protein LOC132042829 n=1 Tax=Lycium ferocissimum TaxID=112874 RepID=UPI0028151455|nr:uncharacterized protein LOC132042829 [Lycium ferocissimum]
MDANLVESSSIATDPNRPSIEEVVKSFSIEKYGVTMPLNGNKDLSGDFVVRSTMGKGFDTFRGILRQQGLENFFRASCFGLYLDLPEDTGARFQMTMVSELLKRKIICDRKDEIWINYCGMPVCFGMKEFAIVTGLRCYPCEPLPTVVLTKPARTPKAAKKAKGSKAKNDVSLVNLVGKSYTQKKLLQDLESKTFSKKHKEALCLVWFVHSVLWARDVNYNIPLGLIKLGLRTMMPSTTMPGVFKALA